MAYEKAIRSLQFGPGTAIAFSLVPVLLFFILLLSRFMRRDAVADEKVTWQDRIIDGVGSLISLVFTVVALPFQLISRAWRAVFPSRNAKTSMRRQKRVENIVRGIALTLLLAFILFPFYWILITAFKGNLQIGQRVDIFWPNPWTTEQFERLFFEEPFFRWFGNSIIVSVVTTALAVVLAALGGYALARLNFRGVESMTTL
ncbi:MAG: carbohydrate ABC transporter permease, partial [Caldilineaceae bacterium]|nr:carbohydrate ABC transporter permease [Caldilineaceae bacterium]